MRNLVHRGYTFPNTESRLYKRRKAAQNEHVITPPTVKCFHTHRQTMVHNLSRGLTTVSGVRLHPKTFVFPVIR